MLYAAYQAHADLFWAPRALARTLTPFLDDARFGVSHTRSARRVAAACHVLSLAEVTHRRPDYGIDSVSVGTTTVPVSEEVVHQTPFGTLLHFEKDMLHRGPPVLVVAPMSGHFATLLRETVRTMLQDHDVYITDWHNARDVPLWAGRFGFDDYVEHLMDFLREIGPGAHLVAVCQPCVAALAAASVMAEEGDEAAPRSITLMAGPVDCRVSPTMVNRLATDKPIEWFEKNLIAHVPMRFSGALRRVYPGFIQLTAFMQMNLERHVNAFRELYEEAIAGDHDKVSAKRRFYEEYFAVADLPAEFYLETVRLVFQEYALAKGELRYRGRPVSPAAIKRTALLTVEGERDDICSLGQTLAAHDLCTSLRPYMRNHYIQAGVGHYGVFSGQRWANYIYPVVRETIHAVAD